MASETVVMVEKPVVVETSETEPGNAVPTNGLPLEGQGQLHRQTIVYIPRTSIEHTLNMWILCSICNGIAVYTRAS